LANFTWLKAEQEECSVNKVQQISCFTNINVAK